MLLGQFLEKNPPIIQRGPSECGIAVVEWLYRAFSQECPKNLEAFVDSEGLIDGLDTMIHLLSPLGPRFDKTLSLLPQATLIFEEDAEHWVVVLAKNSRSLLFMDPEEGFRVVPLPDFDLWFSRTQRPFTALYLGQPPGFPEV